jgi:UDP:flavonoid glycosyltransferase YjiC (YdhE family)
MIPLARALRHRGHDVAVATEVGWHPQVAAEGFDALAAGRPHELAWQHAASMLGGSVAFALEHRGDEVFALIFGEGHANTKAPQLAESAERWAADAIVFESGDLAGPAVATALGLPSVHHSWGPMLPATWFEAATARVEPAWNTFDLAPPPLAGMFGGLYVDLAPPRFRSEPPPGERVEMRPVLADPGAVPAWLRRLKPPLVYVTLGTLFNDPRLLRTLVDALDGVGSAVVTTGRDVDPAALGVVPLNVHVERFLPQSQVLPLAAAAIGHGGSGSTLGALAHGVPMVLLPMGADQFHVAARSASAGAAIIVRPHEANPATVHRALHTVLDDESYRNAARAVQDELTAMPTPTDTAATVEQFVARRR